MSHMIEVKGLKNQFDDFMAVKSIKFNIHPGEVVGFLYFRVDLAGPQWNPGIDQIAF